MDESIAAGRTYVPTVCPRRSRWFDAAYPTDDSMCFTRPFRTLYCHLKPVVEPLDFYGFYAGPLASQHAFDGFSLPQPAVHLIKNRPTRGMMANKLT